MLVYSLVCKKVSAMFLHSLLPKRSNEMSMYPHLLRDVGMDILFTSCFSYFPYNIVLYLKLDL